MDQDNLGVMLAKPTPQFQCHVFADGVRRRVLQRYGLVYLLTRVRLLSVTDQRENRDVLLHFLLDAGYVR